LRPGSNAAHSHCANCRSAIALQHHHKVASFRQLMRRRIEGILKLWRLSQFI
jgi:hypothetical protein